MEPKFERNEKQKEALELAKAHYTYCGFVFFLCILGGLFIGGTLGAICGSLLGCLIAAFWLPVGYGLYLDSKDPLIGSKTAQMPPDYNKKTR